MTRGIASRLRSWRLTFPRLHAIILRRDLFRLGANPANPVDGESLLRKQGGFFLLPATALTARRRGAGASAAPGGSAAAATQPPRSCGAGHPHWPGPAAQLRGSGRSRASLKQDLATPFFRTGRLRRATKSRPLGPSRAGAINTPTSPPIPPAPCPRWGSRGARGLRPPLRRGRRTRDEGRGTGAALFPRRQLNIMAKQQNAHFVALTVFLPPLVHAICTSLSKPLFSLLKGDVYMKYEDCSTSA